MKYLKEYNSFDPILNKRVDDFIEYNRNFVLQYWDNYKSDEQNIEDIKNYLKEFPNLMDSTLDKVTELKPNSNFPKYTVSLQNI
jgi:hypothetical protein